MILSSTAKGLLIGEDTQWQRVCFDIRTNSQLEANYNRSFKDCRCICPFPSPIPGNVSSYDACANRLLFPYGLDFNDEVVPTNDDDSSGIINLKTFFPYYDTFYESLYVNTNGVISFEGVVNDYTPDPFPLMDTWPMIAPFWADVDTTNGGAIYYREMVRKDDEKLAQSIDRIIRGNDVTQANFELIWMFVATWDQVAFYVLDQPRPMINNTFQALLVTDGRSSFTIFNYAHIHWTTGHAGGSSIAGDPDGLGGIEAQVGYNVGDGVRYYTVMGSRTEDIVDIEEKSNVGVPGRYIFNVGGESVVDPDCHSSQDRDNSGSLILYPASGSMLGGNAIQVQGPCFQNTDKVMCRFISDNDAGPTTTCQFFGGRTVSCVVPILLRIGRVHVFLSIDDGATFGFRGIYTSVSTEDVTGAIPYKVRLDTNGIYPKVVWPSNALDGSYYDIDIYVFKDGADSIGLENGRIRPTVVNDMAIESPNLDLEFNLTIRLLSKGNDVGIIRISQGDEEPGEQNSFATSIWSDPFDLSIFTDLNVPKWCSAWRNVESFNSVQLASSDGELRCPCNLQSALIDRGRFSPSPRCSNTVHESCVDEVNIVHCVRSSTPSSEGHGLECCYDTNGALSNIEDNIDAGYAHRYHHLGREPFDEIGRVPYLSHFLHDILPYRRCCKDKKSCSANFIPARPSHDCSGYQPPRPARMNGDPHIQTLDGLAYTFNGHGEYVLMNSLDGMFMMQGRTEPLQVTGNVRKATRFTAIAAQYNNGTNIHVSLNEIHGLAVHVTDSDSQWSQIRFDLTPIWYDTGITIFYSEETNVTSVSVTVAFDFGLVFIVEAANDIMSIVVVGPETMRGNTSGLLGNWNDDVADDLQTPDGDYLPSNSSIRDIHYDFGEKWRIAIEDSVFYYGTGTDYKTYSHPNFVPWFEQPNNIDQALVFAVCGDNPECIFDFQVTGDAEIAKVTKQRVESFEEIVKSVIPVVVCGFIPAPSNGTKNGSVYTEGGVLVFDCNDGYSISNGASTIYCTQEGFWSDSVPSCVKDEVVCEFIDAPQNGAKNGSLYVEGSIIHFKCDVGFTLNGQSKIRCTDGEWSDMAPSCVKEDNYWNLIYIAIGVLGVALLVIPPLGCCFCRRRSDGDVLQSSRGTAVQNDYAYHKSDDDVLHSSRGTAVQNDYAYHNYTYETGSQTVQTNDTYATSIFKTGQ
ncbi:sushi domain-containing protein 2-like [Anneissia japonica]|uniref:sushi domain-containing protein 2-like n=1 Tax=Anneissia japonica TaxID=1529436 RepID=UPI0014258E62|nr:sushi domain-containing protein 2-like [Anneissia japonica]